MSASLLELSKVVNGKIIGDDSCIITSVSNLITAEDGQISFLFDKKYKKKLNETKASAIILKNADKKLFNGNCIVVDNPRVAYAQIASLLHPLQNPTFEVHSSAIIHNTANINSESSIGANCVIEENVVIGKNVIIYPGCYIGRDSVVGEGTRIYPNVVIKYGSVIGDRCIIDSGTIIGSDGFGFANNSGSWIKVPQLGCVVIGDDVHIGSNTTIDRGAIDNTIIENGVIIDNLIQIAHNVVIGEHTVIASSTAIAGSTHIGKNCMIGGTVGIAGHLEIADNVTLSGGAVVLQDVKDPGVYSSGTLLDTYIRNQKNNYRFKKLDEMARQIKELEKTITELNNKG